MAPQENEEKAAKKTLFEIKSKAVKSLFFQHSPRLYIIYTWRFFLFSGICLENL